MTPDFNDIQKIVARTYMRGEFAFLIDGAATYAAGMTEIKRTESTLSLLLHECADDGEPMTLETAHDRIQSLVNDLNEILNVLALTAHPHG